MVLMQIVSVANSFHIGSVFNSHHWILKDIVATLRMKKLSEVINLGNGRHKKSGVFSPLS